MARTRSPASAVTPGAAPEEFTGHLAQADPTESPPCFGEVAKRPPPPTRLTGSALLSLRCQHLCAHFEGHQAVTWYLYPPGGTQTLQVPTQIICKTRPGLLEGFLRYRWVTRSLIHPEDAVSSHTWALPPARGIRTSGCKTSICTGTCFPSNCYQDGSVRTGVL